MRAQKQRELFRRRGKAEAEMREPSERSLMAVLPDFRPSPDPAGLGFSEIPPTSSPKLRLGWSELISAPEHKQNLHGDNRIAQAALGLASFPLPGGLVPQQDHRELFSESSVQLPLARFPFVLCIRENISSSCLDPAVCPCDVWNNRKQGQPLLKPIWELHLETPKPQRQ